MSKGAATRPDRIPRKIYEAELLRLQGELVKVQEWVRAEGNRLVVIFEGRDPGEPGVEVLGDPLDGAALAGGVAALEDDDDALLLGPDPLLDLDQLDLEPEQLGLVDRGRELLVPAAWSPVALRHVRSLIRSGPRVRL